MMALWSPHQWGRLGGPPLWAEKVEMGRSGWREGWGAGADQHGDLYHYLLTGQTDKWKNRHRDKQTARERSRTQGSLFYFTTGNVTDTIKMGGGGGEESTSSVQPKEAAGMAEWRQGVGGLRSPQPAPSEVSFLSNEGSGGLAGLIGGSGFFSALGI